MLLSRLTIVSTWGCCKLCWKPWNCNKHQALHKPQNTLEELMREVKPHYIAVPSLFRIPRSVESVPFWQPVLGCSGDRCLFPPKTLGHEGTLTLPIQKWGRINPFVSWLYLLPHCRAHTAPPFQIPAAPNPISSPASPSLELPYCLLPLFHVQGLKFRYF